MCTLVSLSISMRNIDVQQFHFLARRSNSNFKENVEKLTNATGKYIAK